MKAKIDKLFVYGTLLKGEPRNHLIHDCKLLGIEEVPGRLYDTGKGYPAAVFGNPVKGKVIGEVYLLGENPEKKLKLLDQVEGVEGGLYRRRVLLHNGLSLYTYEASYPLKDRLLKNIASGNWRRYGSVAFKDPGGFSISFERHQKRSYRDFSCSSSNELIFLKGDIPVLITAPHATSHLRMNKLKYEEEYTGAISVVLHILTGSHTLYTNCALKTDPNFYEHTPFKERIREIVEEFGIRFVIDLHGTRTQTNNDIYPGIGKRGEFLLGNQKYFSLLEESTKAYGLTLGGLHVFSASRQMTVTKFVSQNLKIPAMQLEINRELRNPQENPSGFKNLIEALLKYIRSIQEIL
jgi:gamma-glutamylcyclotransferase (GGCT)/AIG2-like uncharacterized protein YtfP